MQHRKPGSSLLSVATDMVTAVHVRRLVVHAENEFRCLLPMALHRPRLWRCLHAVQRAVRAKRQMLPARAGACSRRAVRKGCAGADPILHAPLHHHRLWQLAAGQRCVLRQGRHLGQHLPGVPRQLEDRAHRVCPFTLRPGSCAHRTGQSPSVVDESWVFATRCVL